MAPIRKSNCDFQMKRYSCGFLGNESQAQAVADVEFELNACKLLRLHENLALAAKVLRGRKLLLLGDSLTRQHFMELLCALSQGGNESLAVTHDKPQWVRFTHPSICGAVRCSHTPGEKALLSSDHCYRFRVGAANFSICHEYVVQNIDAALRGATRKFRLTVHDVIVANVGAHSDEAFTEKFDEFASTLNRSLAIHNRPLVIYRQPAPFHTCSNATPSGLLVDAANKEGARRGLNHRIGMPQLPCSPAVRPWVDSLSIRRSVALIVELGIPVLQVGAPLREQWGSHVENGDCGHWCQAGPLSMWNDVLLTYLASWLGEGGAPAEPVPIFRWPTPASSLVLGPGWNKDPRPEAPLGHRTYAKPIRMVASLPQHARALYWDPLTGEILAVSNATAK